MAKKPSSKPKLYKPKIKFGILKGKVKIAKDFEAPLPYAFFSEPLEKNSVGEVLLNLIPR